MQWRGSRGGGPPPQRSRRLAPRRLDVLIQPEEVGRVVTILERDQALVGLAPVGFAHAFPRLLEQVVGIRAASQERPQAGKALARPPDVLVVSGPLSPFGVDEQVVLGAREVQRVG